MKKQKAPNPEKVQRELARLQAEKAKPKAPGYLIYFILVVTIIYGADEITTNIGTQMQSILASQIFAPVVGEEFAVARMSALGIISTILSAFAFIYKPLSDRYGRRIFLVINTLGMGLGMLLVGIATNIPVYLIGASVIAFFTPHDMHQVYIYESTPAKHRGKIYSIIKAFATMVILLIPVLRGAFVSPVDYAGWRNVYFLPAAVTIVVALLALVLIRESDAFVDNRIRILSMTEEEKEAARKKKQAVDDQGGFIKALKYICTHKQLLWLTIGHGLFMYGMVMTMYYETTMTYGYAQQFIAQGMSLETAKAEASQFVTQALLLFPVGSALCQLIQGFFADGLGRKPAVIIMSSCAVISFALFYLGSNMAWSPYLVGFLSGTTVGSYWSAGDILGLMENESAPTNLRSSVMSAQPIFSGVIYSVSMFASMILINVLGDAAIGTICLLVSVPGMVIGILILCAKVKETKGIDMGSIRGDEFEN